LGQSKQAPEPQDNLLASSSPDSPGVSAGPWRKMVVAGVVVLLSLALLAWQAWWEYSSSLVISDHHQALHLTHAAATHHWLQVQLGLEDPQEVNLGLPQVLRRGFQGAFPNTDDYPPLTFLVAGGAMTLLGKTLAIARISQWFLAAGTLACMARIGWQLGGQRGALLLTTGAATSPWLIHHLFNFTMVPGQTLALSLTTTLILDSRGLTRRGICLALGVVLGLGMLVKYSFLLYSAPLLISAALWGRRFSPGAWRGGVAVLATFLALTALILELQAQYEPEQFWIWDDLSWRGFWRAEALFLLLTVVAWRLGRGGWNSGAGLALAVGVAGLVCSAWYMSHLNLMFNLVKIQWSSAPLSRELIWDGSFVSSNMVFLGTFYSLGLPLMLLALILPGNWRRWGPGYPVIVSGFMGSVALCSILLSPNWRYLAPLLPPMTVAAFLWAARWKWTFIGCLAFQLLVGAMELPWSPPSTPWLPVRTEFQPIPHQPVTEPPFDLMIWRPVALPDAKEPSDPFRVLPPGARVSVKTLGMAHFGPQGHQQTMRFLAFFESYLWRRNPISRWSEEKPQNLDEVDYVLTLSHDPEVMGNPRLVLVPRSDAVIHLGDTRLNYQLFQVVPKKSGEPRQVSSLWRAPRRD